MNRVYSYVYRRCIRGVTYGRIEMVKKQRGYAWAAIVYAIFGLVCLGGWIANIVKLISHADEGITFMAILRIVGILAAPFGTIIGFF